VGGDPGEVEAAGAVLDEDQGVQALERDGLEVEEVGCDDAVGLGGEELPLDGRPRIVVIFLEYGCRNCKVRPACTTATPEHSTQSSPPTASTSSRARHRRLG
jgi:hypothetical protein